MDLLTEYSFIEKSDLEKLKEDHALEPIFKFGDQLPLFKHTLVINQKYKEGLAIRKLEILIVKSIAYYAQKNLSISFLFKPSVLKYQDDIEILELEDLQTRCESILNSLNT